MDGIDVSGYQPGSIGALVSYDFLIAKATQGVDYTSSVYRQQVDAALSRGRCAGLYHWTDGADIATEVDQFARAFGPYAGRVVPFLDFEGSALARGLGYASAWQDRAQQVLGVRPPLYGSLSVIGSAGGVKWTAAYGSNPVTNGYQNAPSVGSIMRQYTSRGILPGYGGYLDLDKFYGTPADWQALIGGQAPALAPVPAPTTKWEDNMYSVVRDAQNGTIYLYNNVTRKRVRIQSVYHVTLVQRHLQSVPAVDNMLQAETDIVLAYMAQVA